VILLEICLNISITFYLFNQLKNRNVDFTYVIVSYDLDNVAKKLQLYKNKNGNFPDSLQQLKSEFPNTNIRDTFLKSTFFKVRPANYYYQKKDDKFILFSTGWDRIPFNSDDIYPNILVKTDSIKLSK
jgi:uncharacterized protein (DUF486 family)